jgi:hypothetical protein
LVVIPELAKQMSGTQKAPQNNEVWLAGFRRADKINASFSKETGRPTGASGRAC